MSSLLGVGCRACLVAVLWVTALDAAVHPPPPADLAASLSGTLDLLWSYVGQAVESAVEPLVIGLDRHESGHDQLVGRLDNQTSQLGNLSSQLDSQTSQLSDRMDNQSSQLDTLSDRLDSQDARLDRMASQLTQLLELSVQQNTQLAKLSSLLSNIQQGQHSARVRDCSDLPPGSSSGVHLVRPGLGSHHVPAYCDLDNDGGNWIVIQRRSDIQPRQDFYLGWHDYKWGLGVLTGEFWWGLEHLWSTTWALDRRYELRVDMEDFDGQKRHALYQDFRISPEEDGYRLSVGQYSGDAGDSITEGHGIQFSTRDKDQDTDPGSCAQLYKGGWWYGQCHSANLNGLYLSGPHDSYADGVNWRTWREYHYSLKNVEMKIRPSQTS